MSDRERLSLPSGVLNSLPAAIVDDRTWPLRVFVIFRESVSSSSFKSSSSSSSISS